MTMARYGRDYDRGYHGQGGDGGRFWGPERHLFEGLFSRSDRESGNPGRDYDRDFRAGTGGMGGYGSRNRGYDRDMHMGGSSFSRDYDRDHGIGRGSQGMFGINNQMNDRALGIGRYDTEYGATSRGRNLPYRRDVHVDHDAISRDHLPYRRDVHADHDEISRNTFHGGGRDVYRTGGMGGMNRGGGDWDGDGDRDMGDRLREGWNGLQQGARRVFRGNRDRNW
jgi:hypothetical protein